MNTRVGQHEIVATVFAGTQQVMQASLIVFALFVPSAALAHHH